MKNPRSFRLTLAHGIVASALLASSVSAITPDELYSLRAKAEKGNAIAQYNLGLAFADKREPIYNPTQAYAWLSLASASGTTSKALADLTNSMTPEQIVAGKARLAELSSSPAASPISAAVSATSPIISADSPIAPAITAEAAPDQKKLSAELSAAWEENQLLKTSLNAQLADANKRIAIAEAALANKDRQIAALEARATETAAIAAVATPAPTPAPATPTIPPAVLAELTALRAERDQLQASSAAVASELATLRVNAARQANDQSVLATKLERANETLAEARRAQNLAESEATSLKTAATRATAERTAISAQLEAARNELEVAKAAAVAAQTAANASAAALASASQSAPTVPVTTTAPAVPVNNEELIAVKADRDRFAETAKSLAEERDTLVAQLAVAKAAIPATPAPNTTVAPIPTTPETPAITPERLAELEKAKEESDSKLSAALRSYTLQQTEIERLQKALASIDGERAELASKLETARSDTQGLRLQAEAAGSATVEANSLRTQLADLKATSTTQAAALTRSEQALADARRTVDAATTDLVSTRDLLRQTQAQSAAFANENQQLKTRIALAGNIGSPNPSRPNALSGIAVSVPTATAPSTTSSAPSTTTSTSTPATGTTASATISTPAPVTPIGATAMAIPRIHTVGTGDTLSKISKQYYFTAARWNDILQANRDVIKNPNALTVGTKLRIP